MLLLPLLLLLVLEASPSVVDVAAAGCWVMDGRAGTLYAIKRGREVLEVFAIAIARWSGVEGGWVRDGKVRRTYGMIHVERDTPLL